MDQHEEKKGLDLDATLLETSHKIEVFYKNNRNPILVGASVIILAIAGYMGFKTLYLEPLEEEAQIAIFPAQAWFEKDSFNFALNGQGEDLGFLAIADQYGITKAGNLSHYYAGVCYMQKNDYENAIDQLESFSTSNKLLGPIATGLLGDAYVESGNLEKGASKLMKAAEMSKNKLTSPIYLKKAALVFEELKEYSKAADLYEKIKKDHADAPEGQDVDKYIARAKARSASAE